MGSGRGTFWGQAPSHAGASTVDHRAVVSGEVLQQRAVALAPALLQGLRTFQVSVCAREGGAGDIAGFHERCKRLVMAACRRFTIKLLIRWTNKIRWMLSGSVLCGLTGLSGVMVVALAFFVQLGDLLLKLADPPVPLLHVWVGRVWRRLALFDAQALELNRQLRAIVHGSPSSFVKARGARGRGRPRMRASSPSVSLWWRVSWSKSSGRNGDQTEARWTLKERHTRDLKLSEQFLITAP